MDRARIIFTRSSGAGKEMSTDFHAIDPDGKNEPRPTMNQGNNKKYAGNAAPAPGSRLTLAAFLKR